MEWNKEDPLWAISDTNAPIDVKYVSPTPKVHAAEDRKRIHMVKKKMSDRLYGSDGPRPPLRPPPDHLQQVKSELSEGDDASLE